MANIIFAPHLDDEIIGCFSILASVDKIIYFSNDYRGDAIKRFPDDLKGKYISHTDFDFESINRMDTLYLPSRYDFHPYHREVRNKGLLIPSHKKFYSTDMNVPWIEQEEQPNDKMNLLKQLYFSNVNEFRAKQSMFKSIQPFDEISYAQDWYVWNGKEMGIYIQKFTESEVIKIDHSTVDYYLNRFQSVSLSTIHRVISAIYNNRKIKLEYNGSTIE